MTISPLEHARAVKSQLRAAGIIAREVRKAWTGLRSLDRHEWKTFRVAAATVAMWDADAELAAVAEEWRLCLAERTAMPVAERWDLAALERWAIAQDKDGAT